MNLAQRAIIELYLYRVNGVLFIKYPGGVFGAGVAALRLSLPLKVRNTKKRTIIIRGRGRVCQA